MKWYGSAWMSCVYCRVYQVHNYESRWKWLACLKARLKALDLHITWLEEESGIYYRIAKKPVVSELFSGQRNDF